MTDPVIDAAARALRETEMRMANELSIPALPPVSLTDYNRQGD